jgi:hypothetical protein
MIVKAAESLVGRHNHMVDTPVHYGWGKVTFAAVIKAASLHGGDGSLVSAVIDPIGIRVAFLAKNLWGNKIVIFGVVDLFALMQLERIDFGFHITPVTFGPAQGSNLARVNLIAGQVSTTLAVIPGAGWHNIFTPDKASISELPCEKEYHN